MYGRNRGWMLWAAAATAAAAAVVVLAVVLARPSPDGTGSMVTPTMTGTTTAGNTVTATAGDTVCITGTPASTATGGATTAPGATATGGPTVTPGATSTPGPTSTLGGDGYAIFFTEANYQVSGEVQDFYTTINITPVELFFGAQFGLEWDCTLFEMRTGWTRSHGGGRLYNGTSPNPGWTRATQVAVNLDGDNNQCPDPTQGLARFAVDWGNYWWITHDYQPGLRIGVNVTAPPAGPDEGQIVRIRWRTYGPSSGTTFNQGTTDINFIPGNPCKIIGFWNGPYEYTKPVEWTGTKVEVN